MYIKNIFPILIVLIFLPLISVGSRASVLAHVGTKNITDDQIRQEYGQATTEQKNAVNKDETKKRGLIDSMVNAELVVQAATKAGFEKDPDYLKALEGFKRQYLASKFMQKVIEPKLTKAAIKKYFDAHKTTFDSTQICAHHIVVQDEGEAQKILAMTKVQGASFEEIAKKYSLDPTVSDNKGDLGCFTRDKMVPEFVAAAFSMHVGQIKGPVRTMYGYHIIKVDDIKLGRIPGFEEVEQRVKDSYRVRLVQDMVNDLRSKSNVQVNEESVKKFRL